MKTIKKISILFLVTILSSFVWSCSSSSDGGGGGGSVAGEGTIKAKVGGSWVTTMEITTFATISSSMFHFQGNNENKAFSVNIYNFDGVGVYKITSNDFASGVFNHATYTETIVDMSNPMNSQVRNWMAPYEDSGEVGEVNVTEVTDTYVKGTFHFKAQESSEEASGSIKEVTDGSFYINLMQP